MRFKTVGIAAALMMMAIGSYGQGFGFGSPGGAGRIATVSITQDTAAGIETWQLAGMRAKDGSVKTSLVYASTETGTFLRGHAIDGTLNAPFEGKWSGVGTWCGKACTWSLSATAQPPLPNNAPAITQMMGVKFAFCAKVGASVVCRREGTSTDPRCLVVVMP